MYSSSAPTRPIPRKHLSGSESLGVAPMVRIAHSPPPPLPHLPTSTIPIQETRLTPLQQKPPELIPLPTMPRTNPPTPHTIVLEQLHIAKDPVWTHNSISLTRLHDIEHVDIYRLEVLLAASDVVGKPVHGQLAAVCELLLAAEVVG